jgi:hypothetical protein
MEAVILIGIQASGKSTFQGFDLLYHVTIGTDGELIVREWTDEIR